jgi:hypothetical protein
MQCPYCGEHHPDSAQFCPRTGNTLAAPVQTSKRLYVGIGIFSLLLMAVALVFLFADNGSWSGSTLNPTQDPSGGVPVSQLNTPTLTPQSIPSETPTRTSVPTSTRTRMVTSTPTLRTTRTPKVTPTEDSWVACQGTYPSRLHIGDHAYVSSTPFLANRVRSKPSLNSKIIGRIQPGEYMEVLDGPACSHEWVWWYVRAEKDDLVGWTSEGDSENYWLVPAH